MQPYSVSALIVTLAVGFPALGAELTSIDFVSLEDWRYFHSDEANLDRIALDTSLSSSGFYDQWMMTDFNEADVLAVSWRDTDLPLVFGQRRTGKPSQDAVFLRKTFELSEPSVGPIGLGVLAYDSFAVYLDGNEVFRHNCCEDAAGNPTADPLGLLDHAFETKFDRRKTYADLGDLALSVGPHTVGVAIHAAPEQSLVTLADFRLFQPGNEATWTVAGTSDHWSDPDNWLFGVPSDADFAVFSFDDYASVKIDNAVTIGGLRVRSYATSFFHGESITLAGTPTTRFDSLGTGVSFVAARMILEADMDVHTETDVLLTSGVTFNGHVVTKTGAGELFLPGFPWNPSDPIEPGGRGTLRVNDGILSANGTLPVDLFAQGGVVVVNRSLGVTGDFTGDIRLKLDDHLDGRGVGTAEIQTLQVTTSPYRPQDGDEFQLLTGWESIRVQSLILPDIGNAEWDISRIEDGVLAIRHEVQPCDFDASAWCDRRDFVALEEELNSGRNSTEYDVNRDGTLDRRDEEQWLVQAGELNGYVPSYLPGDVSLDGTVNHVDLRLMNIRWAWQLPANTYLQGDFDFSGFVDAADLNLFGLHFGKSVVKQTTAPVPETGYAWLTLLVLSLIRIRRR